MSLRKHVAEVCCSGDGSGQRVKRTVWCVCVQKPILKLFGRCVLILISSSHIVAQFDSEPKHKSCWLWEATEAVPISPQTKTSF